MDRTKLLIRTAAVYAFIGAFLGSHMAGSAQYAFRSVHAHILVVGWLSLFAFGVFYRMFPIPAQSRLALAHVWTAVIGSIGLTAGMWLYYVKPMPDLELFNTVFFIVGGTTLLISFALFLVIVFVFGKYIGESPKR